MTRHVLFEVARVFEGSLTFVADVGLTRVAIVNTLRKCRLEYVAKMIVVPGLGVVLLPLVLQQVLFEVAWVRICRMADVALVRVGGRICE